MTDLPELPDDLHIPDHIGSITDHDDDLMPSQTSSVQVISGIDIPAGSPYVCEVRPTDDVAISLTRDKALAYAAAVWTAAIQAVYFAGIRAQLRDVMNSRGRRPGDQSAQDLAEWATQQFTLDVPAADPAATAPMTFQPAHRISSNDPMVQVAVNGETLDRWTPTQALHHARCVMNVAVAADLDTTYRNFAAVGLRAGEQRARAMVRDLGHYLPRLDAQPDTTPEPVIIRTPVPGPRPGAKPAAGRRHRRR